MIGWTQRFVTHPQLLALIVTIDIFAYFAGLLFWYGGFIIALDPPIWAWLFIPDCPLFALLGALGLLMVNAQQRSNQLEQQETQRVFLFAGGIALLFWASTYLPIVPETWQQQAAMFGILAVVLFICAFAFQQVPTWLLGIFVAGQIKYGIWTVQAWLLYWINTAEQIGAPLFRFDGVLMTVSHVAMILQGLALLTFLRPDWRTALAAILWFGLSDYVDYGVGFHPPVYPDLMPIETLQWTTVAVTILLSSWFILADRFFYRHAASRGNFQNA